jgi:hypothetical protein
MPYVKTPSYQLPADEKATIWRYIDLAKFVSMLDHRALFFSQAARLADPFEGSYPEPTVRARSEYFRSQAADSESPQLWRNIEEAVSNNFAKMRTWMYVNCWHLNECESAAMWELYGQRGSSIAIRATFARLRDSMASAPGAIVIGAVRYIDYAKEHVSERNQFNPFLCKRRSYAHEQELRALHLHDPKAEEPAPLPAGLDIACDLETLIDTIFVSPGAPSWFREVVKSITERYGIAKPVFQSSLDNDPVY